MTSSLVKKGADKTDGGYYPRSRTRANVTSKATVTNPRIDTKAGSFDGENPNKVNYVTSKRARPSNGAN